MKHIICAPNAPAAIGPYNHAIEAMGFVFTSGQVGVDPKSGKLGDTLEKQAEQCLRNVETVLAAAGATMKDVVKCTVFLHDMNDFQAVNAIYKEAFQDEFPARSCVQVAKLPAGALVEIEAVAVKP